MAIMFLFCVYRCVWTSPSVCVPVHMCCSHVCMEASGWEWVSSLVATHPIFWGRISHWAWSLPAWGDWLVIKLQEASQLCFLRTGFADIPCYARLFMDAGDPNTGPHACVANSLHTKPSPQSLQCILKPWIFLLFSKPFIWRLTATLLCCDKIYFSAPTAVHRLAFY